MIYACPVCKEPLRIDGRSLQCSSGHNYDLAREGYVNLLLANQKRSREPGDNQKMVANRRRFFAKGFYDPVADKVNDLIFADVAASGAETAVNILDCGCGEGYFLQKLHTALPDAGRYALCGIDISKFAIKAAAKRDKATDWAVASVYDLPVLPDSVDYLLNIMAPQSAAEMERVLKDNGRLLVVNPGPNHLFGLRKELYERPEAHKAPPKTIPGFDFVASERVNYTVEMQNEDIVDLFVMTPYSWNAPPSAREKIMALDALTMEIDFLLTVFEKRAV